MKKGLFISIEGGEGAGKSSMILRLNAYLSSLGHSVVLTREPGGIQIAEQIREVILNKQNTAMDARTEVLLYAAARRQHLVEKIMPAIAQEQIVICDRFIDNSLAYQGYARGIGILEVLQINQFAIQECMPDLTLYMDVTPEVGLARIHKDQQREINRLDLETIDFHRKVREGYHKLLSLFPERIIQVNAEYNQEKIFAEIKPILHKKLII